MAKGRRGGERVSRYLHRLEIDTGMVRGIETTTLAACPYSSFFFFFFARDDIERRTWPSARDYEFLER